MCGCGSVDRVGLGAGGGVQLAVGGRLGGRPAKLSPEQAWLARARYEAPGVTVAEIAKALGVSRGTIYRALQQTP
jgi:DNA invertase Pin-like site-specific DNA recombinase